MEQAAVGQLGRDPDIVMQKLRRKIGSVGPHQSMEIGIETELLEHVGIL